MFSIKKTVQNYANLKNSRCDMSSKHLRLSPAFLEMRHVYILLT